MSEMNNLADEWLKNVASRMQDDKQNRAAIRAEKLTVREFLAKFGRARRRDGVVREIRHKLEEHNLRTSPDFEFAYIDNSISIELDDDDTADGVEEEPASPTVHVDSLQAAHNKPASVSPSDTVVLAITIMRIKGFSQLPVMTNERDVKGVISWRSIGMAYSNGGTPERVEDCMEQANEIGVEAMFEDAARAVWKHDYALVRGEHKKITGILTAADLALQFEELAHPFLQIGEIEYHLRNLVRDKFTVDELTAVAKGEKDVRGPGDLTFGDYCQLFGREDLWGKLGLNIDRREFIRHLEEVRIIRNDVMHFSPDGIEPEDVGQLTELLEFLRQLSH